MSIQPPSIHLSKNDRKLLAFIARILVEPASDAGHRNIPDTHIALSDEDAEKLIHLLDALLNSPDFIQSCNFIQGMSHLKITNERDTRFVYTTGLRRKSKSTTVIYHSWYELQARLGLRGHYLAKNVRTMDDEYFFDMEEHLFENLDLDPRVISLLMKLGKERMHIIRQFQMRRYGAVDISESAKRLQYEVKKKGLASRVDLSAVAFVISNSSVLFTTRDWSAAGVFSCMIGHAVGAVKTK